MQSRFAVSLGFIFALVLPVANFVTTSGSRAQSPQKPELKEFGSSLKKLKWDPDKKTTVEIGSPTKPDGAPADVDVVKVQTDLITLDVQVRDRQGRVVSDLTRDDFIITEDAQPQTIGHFTLGNDQTVGRSIVLILDYSGSLRHYLNTSIDAAEVLIKKLGPRDRMAIVTDDVKLISGFTNDARQLNQALESLRKKANEEDFGRSFQLTALMATVRELFDEEDIRPIVIFQTDGDEVGLLQPPDLAFYWMPMIPEHASDTTKQHRSINPWLGAKLNSRYVKPYGLADIYKAVEKSRATVYTVIPGEQLLGLSPNEQFFNLRLEAKREYSNDQVRQIQYSMLRAQKAADGAAAVSGGWTAFLNKPEDAPDIYSRILADINSRYVIGYYPTNKIHDGRRRMVSVTLRGHPEYVISGRRSYYAPEPEP
jgi:VWFA-related protein